MHIFVHLLNDFSGSPRVLNQKIQCYREAGEDCLVITNDGNGFIDLAGIPHRLIPYRKDRNRIIWAARLLLWHIRTFFLILRISSQGDVLHANTLLTALHLIAAKIKGASTVIHIHEVRVSSGIYRALTFRMIAAFADRIVYVSRYVEDTLKPRFAAVPCCITYPCVDPTIAAASGSVTVRTQDVPFVIGLICSMTWYKGYREFIALAQRRPQFRFLLVLNGDVEKLAREIPPAERPSNLDIRFNLPDVGNVLGSLSVLLSLTNRAGWIETFGLTLIEGMTFGVPAIAPDIGAPREFVEPGINGYLVDETDLDAIAVLIDQIHADPACYHILSAGARETAARFSPTAFRSAVNAERRFILED